MEYRSLGKSGLKISELSFGAWITFTRNVELSTVKECMKTAFDLGVNFFDNAETYGDGAAELLMGEALRNFRREDVVVSTKIFWGGEGPNDQGLSWKRMVEGAKNSLRRLQLEYVDLLFCHRPDPTTPIEETVRAMDTLIKQGLIFYWGTSEWSPEEIKKAYSIAEEIGATPLTTEQPEYNMFNRTRVEEEYTSLFEKYGMGATTWSPLNSGILTGKYNEGIPEGSRFHKHEWLRRILTPEKITKCKLLEPIAKRLDCSLAQLALAWILKNPHVSTVITGATSPDQIRENMHAVEVKKRLDQESMKEITQILKGTS